MAALEEISKMCGEVKSKEKDKTASTPLVTVTDLQKMKFFQAIIMRIRMAPYKVQYTPDFKINWGIERKDFPFPHREEKPVPVFDLKTYVSEEKRKQMMENAQNGEQPVSPFNPFGGIGMGANSFMNSMPNFGDINNSSTTNSANPLGINTPNKPLSALSNDEIDKMIADIDKKLAELEEEEKKEKEKQQKESNEQKVVELPKLEEKKVEETTSVKDVNSKVEDDKPKINVDADSIVMNDNVITDDEFFDDFFGDE